ncbi:MAG: hypothetical protein ABIP48_13035 [Planctomycetota bacterium]
MKPVQRWSLVAAGGGTVILAFLRVLARAGVAKGLDRVSLIDPAVIREVNALTCSEYAGHCGKTKVDRLAELLGQWLEGVKTAILPHEVENVDWTRLLGAGDDAEAPAGPVIVLIGLDQWQSRMNLIEDLRHAAAGKPGVLAIQVAVERDQAQVSVFGNRWEDPCPGCGLLQLPASEPCVLFQADGELVRGNLGREAGASAVLAVRIVTDHLAANGSAGSWVNTKTNLHAVGRGDHRFHRYTRERVRTEGCLGPHGEATPIRLEDLFRESEEVHHHVCDV